MSSLSSSFLSLFIDRLTIQAFGLLDGGKAQIANPGSGEGTNWLLEHQFQTHPKDPIFILMLLYRWSQEEQKHLVLKTFITWRLMRGVETSDSSFGTEWICMQKCGGPMFFLVHGKASLVLSLFPPWHPAQQSCRKLIDLIPLN